MSVIVASAHRSNVSVWVAFILLVVGTIGAYQIVGLNQALLFLIGGALGMTLYHASFGFTSSWRVLLKNVGVSILPPISFFSLSNYWILV